MNNNKTQTDIFSLFGIEDEYGKKQEEEKKKREQQQAEITKKMKESANSSQSSKEPFVLERDTRIFFYNEEYSVLDFFTDEEIELGLPSGKKDGDTTYKPISESDVRNRLAKQIPVLAVGAEVFQKTYKDKPNILVISIKAKKKGNNWTEEEPNGSFSSSKKKIPFNILKDFIGVSKYFSNHYGTEVHGDVYYDTSTEMFSLEIPKQQAHKYWVKSTQSEEEIALRIIENRHEIKVMEIHSHHTMRPLPSTQDDESEVFPIVYAIIGNIDDFFPDITVRTYDLGNQRHKNLNPFSIFEQPIYSYPDTYNLDVVEVLK